MLNRVISYFDINRDIHPGLPEGVSESQPIHWMPQWIALFLGILIQPSFQEFRDSGAWTFTGWEWALFAVISAILIFPSVYRGAFDPKKPIIVLLAPIFAGGLGWESLLGTALKLASGP